MPIPAGGRITASRLNRLRPAMYRAVETASMTGPQTNADITGLTLTFNTETANAEYIAWLVVDMDLSGATTSTGNARLVVDGTGQNEFAVFAGEVATDRGTYTQVYYGTLASSGSHTLKGQTTIVANQTLNIYTSLTVQVFEASS